MGFDFVFQTLHGFSAWMYPYEEPKTTWTVINEYLTYAWYNSFMVFMNILMLIGLIGFVYICYLTIYKARSEQKSCDTTRSLSVYNNTMNIHVWLNQAEDYLDDRNIKILYIVYKEVVKSKLFKTWNINSKAFMEQRTCQRSII